MSYSVTADIVSFVALLGAGFIGLWNGKHLEQIAAWRKALEQAATSGTHLVLAEWEKRGLPMPLEHDKVLTELDRVTKQENSVRKGRKAAIIVLMIIGAVLFFVARYFSTLGI